MQTDEGKKILVGIGRNDLPLGVTAYNSPKESGWAWVEGEEITSFLEKNKDKMVSLGVPTMPENVAVLTNEYTQLEYIQTNGSQHIETDVSGNNDNLSFDISYSWVELPETERSYRYIIYSYVDEDTNTTRLLQYGNSITYVNINSKAYGGTTTYSNAREIDVVYNETLSNTTYTSKGASVDTSAGSAIKGADNTRSVKLLYNAKAKVYLFKIYDNGVLIRNMVPVKRNSDNALGMYDTVNDVFYKQKNNRFTTDLDI